MYEVGADVQVSTVMYFSGVVAFCKSEAYVRSEYAFVVYRMFSIYIMTVFAPIPLATLPSQEHKHTAFNYLKSYAAACMSGAVILAAFQIYNLLNTSVLKDTFEKALEMGVDAAGNPMPLTAGAFCGVMLKMLIFYGILVSAVLSSGKISKSLLNAA